METYIYKVNRNKSVGYHHGNWIDFFERLQPSPWGREDKVCRFHRPKKGDRILCYQTNLREILGTAEVVGYSEGKLVLKATGDPFPRGITITDLRRIDERIRNLNAFKPGNIRTLYPISNSDGDYLLRTIERFWMDAE